MVNTPALLLRRRGKYASTHTGKFVLLMKGAWCPRLNCTNTQQPYLRVSLFIHKRLQSLLCAAQLKECRPSVEAIKTGYYEVVRNDI